MDATTKSGVCSALALCALLALGGCMRERLPRRTDLARALPAVLIELPKLYNPYDRGPAPVNWGLGNDRTALITVFDGAQTRAWAYGWRDGSGGLVHGTDGVIQGMQFESMFAGGVNDSGDLVAYGVTTLLGPRRHQAFVMSREGDVTLLDAGDGDPTIAYDINNQGVIVGSRETDAPDFVTGGVQRQPVVWQPASVWGESFGMFRFEAVAAGNGAGALVCGNGNVGAEGLVIRAWTVPLANFAGPVSTYEPAPANGVNDDGTMCGSGADAWVRRVDGSVLHLPPLAQGDTTAAYGINNAGDVVGESGARAVLWTLNRRTGTYGKPLDLNSLGVTGSSVTLTAAYRVNDRGDVLCKGVRANEPRAPRGYLILKEGPFRVPFAFVP